MTVSEIVAKRDELVKTLKEYERGIAVLQDRKLGTPNIEAAEKDTRVTVKVLLAGYLETSTELKQFLATEVKFYG